MNNVKRRSLIFFLLLMLLQILPISTVFATVGENAEAEYFIFKMNHGNDWSRLPTDAQISEAFNALPGSVDKSDQYENLVLSYSYGSPQKVHVLHLKDQEKYRFYANQVIITVVETYESQSKLLKDSPLYRSQKEYYLGLKEETDGHFVFDGIGVVQKGTDGEISPVQKPVDYDGSAIYGSGWIDGKPDAGSTTPAPGPLPTTPIDDEDFPIEVVVGGAAAVVVVAVAMANAQKAKSKKRSGETHKSEAILPTKATEPKTSEEKQDAEKPVGYILQLTQDTITLSEGKESIVGIRALKVDEKGQTTVAPNAEIRLQPQKETRLILMPNMGMGELNVKISQNGAAQQDAVETVQITAMLPGKTLDAVLTVTLKSGWRMVFR